MKVLENPKRESWRELCLRPSFSGEEFEAKVSEILSSVEKSGDDALKKMTQEFDGVLLDDFFVKEDEIKEAKDKISDTLKSSIITAKKNIEKFHQAQIPKDLEVETMPGVLCQRKAVVIEKVGLYVPGGSAPLFSTALMLGIPAKIAGCDDIYLCTPPGKDGKINPLILFVADLLEIKNVIKLGGAQAIAAMGIGTESICKVDKIFGPGNQFVNTAKLLLQKNGMAIDLPAGPSEVCVIADESANASFVAADLLSQAEHGKDSQVLLLSTSNEFVKSVDAEVVKQLRELPRKDLAEETLSNSLSIVFSSIEECFDFSNKYAPEHLIISCKDEETLALKVKNAGSVFIGKYSPESVGDYASGTNHTLPTSGAASAWSGVSLDSFYKKITFQKLSKKGLLGLAGTVESMAEAEGLKAHAEAVRIRRQELEALSNV